MLYDLTSLQREANTRFGFSARRTLGAAQRLYEEHKALTYPRTNSRFLTSDMAAEIKPTAELVGARPEYAPARALRDLARRAAARRASIDDAKVTDHHAIIPTRAEHPVEKMDDDDRRVYDLVVRRFLAVFHPDAVLENTRVETTVAGHVFRTRGKVLLVPGWRGVYLARRPRSQSPAEARRATTTSRASSELPRLEQGEPSRVLEIEQLAKETKPPRRYSDASLLGAMETAGKLVDDEELREAMKDSGIGTPATRAAIIERLIDVGYVERDGRSLVATEKGLNVIRLLGEHALTSPDLTGSWEQRLGRIERGEDSREQFMRDIAGFAKRDRRRARRDAQGRPDPARQSRALSGLRPRHHRESQGLLVLGARGSGLRLRHLEGEGRQEAAARDRARADQERADSAPGDWLPRSQRSIVPRPPGAGAERGGQAGASSSTSRGRVRAQSRRTTKPCRSPSKRRRRAGPAQRRLARSRGRPPRRSRASGARADRSRRRRILTSPRCATMERPLPLTLVTGPANSAKAQVVLERYRAALARSPILVVPRSADAEYYRRELAGSGVVLGVRVEPFGGLMRELSARAGVGGERSGATRGRR